MIIYNIEFAYLQIHDVGGYREPRYLDLFEPGVSVVRDPRLDQPRDRRSSRVEAVIHRTLRSVASTRVIVGEYNQMDILNANLFNCNTIQIGGL